MFDIGKKLTDFIVYFFSSLLSDLINEFSQMLNDIMGISIDTLNMPLVHNAIRYMQILASSILVCKVIYELFATYLMRTQGDPDGDTEQHLIRCVQAFVVIQSMPWLVTQVFTFGMKISNDIATLSIGTPTTADWLVMINGIIATGGLVLIFLALIAVVMMVVMLVQAVIRGAELARCAVVGSILALNLTTNNRSTFNMWFRELFIICTTQALQIFMIKGALALATTGIASSKGFIFIIGWLWAGLTTPKWLQGFKYSTGVSSAISGGAKQGLSVYLMRKFK